MNRLLFVDDEPRLLAGLRRSLRTESDRWEMTFVESGEAALTELSGGGYDVLVTDMRMPGIDGAGVLRYAADHSPGTARIVLSGQCNQSEIMPVVHLVHQFLAKPCETDTLIAAVQRTLAMDALLADPALHALVAGAGPLPSLPSVYRQLQAALSNPDATAKEIGDVVAQDIAMTAKVLQMVNSAFFGLRREVNSPREAVTFLGTETLRALALSANLFSQYTGSSTPGFNMEQVGEHSLRCGNVARQVAVAADQPRGVVEQCFLAGMLHDVGRLVLASNAPRSYGDVISRASTGTALVHAEHDEFGASHGAVGAYLLGLWGLPSPVVEAVAYHHEPTLSVMKAFEPLVAVHVADGLIDGDGPDGIDDEWLRSLGLSDLHSRCADLASAA